MSERFRSVQQLLDAVRSRWRRLVLLEVATRAAGAGALVVVAAFVIAFWTSHSSAALAATAVAALLAACAAVVWAVWPVRHVPSDRAVARFIEEREPSLDERLVSAVDVATADARAERPALADAMVADAARAAESIDPHAIVPADALRRWTLRAAAAVAVLLLALVVARHNIRQAYDTIALLLFPSHVTLEVLPGNVKIQSGSDLTIEAHLVGNTAPVVAQLLRAPKGSEEWQPIEMDGGDDGRFSAALQSLTASFRYKVLAGAASSPAFDVSVLRAPRVARIDVEYAYPPALGLEPRIEEDGGDIYGPEGTQVTVKIHTDAPVTSGQMVLGADSSIQLAAESPTVLRGGLKIDGNGSYRVALTDADGMKSRGDTEYFIRILDDRPPEVHIVRPASDRRVTPLEEVEIAAEAQDDFGVSALELVYAIRGEAEKVVPLGIAPRSTSVTGHYVMYLEDFDVTPGDFVSYYVRARDLPRGKPASESRSDIFFLEVKPFEEEFTLAQTQAAMGGGSGNPQLDDLVAAQKEIVVATWKLDRRSRDAQGARSEADIRAVSKSEAELKVRVERTASGFRESTMRDPRRTRPAAPRPGARPQPPSPQPPAPQPPDGTPRVGQSMPEEDEMTTASKAMGRAITSLDALKTADALPHEMEALNALLKAQADVKKRQIQQQRGAGGAGSNRTTEDLSSLFDKELARNQQTNYENKTSAQQTEDPNASAIDRIKDLAQRQDELVRRQAEFARSRGQLSADEARRQLEALTREQNELRDRAEQLAQQLQQGQQQGSQDQTGEPGQQGPRGQSGQSSGQAGQSAGQQGQSGQSGQRRPGSGQNARAGSQGPEGSRQMRDISEQMRSAANDLRKEDAGQASARGAQALQQLRELEQQLQASTPEGQRRALGDLQLEARQLADAQRKIAAESARAQAGQAGSDTLRRLAGEQERLAERLERVQQGLKQSAAAESTRGQSGDRGQSANGAALRQAASDAAREIEQQRLAERMQQSADAMRTSASQPSAGGSTPGGQPDPKPDQKADPRGTPTARAGAANQAGAQQDLARALDRLADRLNLADQPQDDESKRLADQVNRARNLRDRMADLTRQLEELDRQASRSPQGTPQNGQSQGQSAQSNQPGQGAGGSTGTAESAARLRTEIEKQMREVRELLNETQRDAAGRTNGGRGSTFEGQGMVLSAPGTEGFKQDFSTWQELARQITLALDDVESSLSQKLHEKTSKDRLASGADERAPAEYQQQVDSYFKALASRKRP